MLEKQSKKTLPHLCTDCDLTKLTKFPIWGFPKLDGVRGMHITGSMTGRSLKPHGNKYVTEKYSFCRCEGFDGEFTYGNRRGDSLCRDTTSVMSRIEGEPTVDWNLFDYLREDLLDKKYSERYDELVAFYGKHRAWFEYERIFVIPYTVLNSVEEVEAYYDKQLELGYEGAILRGPDGLHKSGRATVKVGAYLRLKASSDKEARVIRLVEAMENLNEAKVNELGRTERSSHKENKVGKGMVGMLQCNDLVTGQEIDVGAGKMTHDERKWFWDHPEEIVGKLIKYKSMDSGVKDKPRFPRFISLRMESDIS